VIDLKVDDAALFLGFGFGTSHLVETWKSEQQKKRKLCLDFSAELSLSYKQCGVFRG